jgi:LmbE family N-acetylglucosaminyl deacetylase
MTNQQLPTPNSGRTQSAPTQTQPYDHVYVSPHFDDVPLSCGGQVAAQTRAGERVLVVTSFTRPPGFAVKRTPFAAAMETEWRVAHGDSVHNIYLRRAEEEKAALQWLGADHLWLNYLDAIYRGKAYNSNATLFGSPTDRDLIRVLPWLSADIAKIAAQQQQAGFYFPLAVGNHVDHQLVHLAGQQLAAQGREVVFYEDFPYAIISGALEQRLRQVPLKLQPTLTDIRATLEDKIAAIAEYASQVDSLFGSDAAMRDQVRRYATLVAQAEGAEGAEQAERYWRPD